MNIKEYKKLCKHLKYGDKVEIARITGYTRQTVHNTIVGTNLFTKSGQKIAGCIKIYVEEKLKRMEVTND